MFTFLSANSKAYQKVNSQCCSKKCCTLRHSFHCMEQSLVLFYIVRYCVFSLFDPRDILQQNDHFKSNPQHLPILYLWARDYSVVDSHRPNRTKDQSLQSWPLVFQYPPCLERDQKYPVSFLSLIIWYILFNTVILPLHVNISAGFRGQVTRKKKKSLRSFNSVLAQTLLENRSKVF